MCIVHILLGMQLQDEKHAYCTNNTIQMCEIMHVQSSITQFKHIPTPSHTWLSHEHNTVKS
jgi:hypothetical protein